MFYRRSTNILAPNRNETKTSEVVPESAPSKEIISIWSRRADSGLNRNNLFSTRQIRERYQIVLVSFPKRYRNVCPFVFDITRPEVAQSLGSETAGIYSSRSWCWAWKRGRPAAALGAALTRPGPQWWVFWMCGEAAWRAWLEDCHEQRMTSGNSACNKESLDLQSFILV